MRNICLVISQIKKYLPPGYEHTRRGLDHVANKSLYTAPESMGRRYRELGYILASDLKGINENWAVTIGKIVRNEA